MNEKFYRQLMKELPYGYSYNKIICDESGIPCDYEILEVNASYERLTGLKSSRIIGRRISEVIPDIKESKFDWLHLYGDIAINGGNKEVKQYFEPFKHWFRVYVYSPEKYYFITHFMDITKEMGRLTEMERLVEISEELLQSNDQKIDYQKIADEFLVITEAKFAVFNLFDEDGKSFTTRAIAGDKGILKKATSILGFKIDKRKWDYNSELAEKIKLSTITRFKNLREIVGSALPAALVPLLEKTFNLGEVILIKIMKHDVMLGEFTLIIERGSRFDKDTIAEVYTRQLGMLITRKRAEDSLLQEKTLTDAIFYSAPGLIYLYDDGGKLVRWNKKHEDFTGYSSEELSKRSLMDWYRGDEKSQIAITEGLTRAVDTGFGDAEAELQKKDGTAVPMYFTASTYYLEGKQYFAGVGIDITEQKKKEAEIFHLSYHDQLTGLYNRRFYEEELLRLDHKRNLPLTIVMGDVNGLKLVNDSFGHVMGDQLLKKVAELLTKGCREDDIIARLAGDEFVILLPKTDAFETKQIIKRIRELSLSEKVGSVDISISFGFETKSNEDENIEEIFKNAEDFMYKKKLFEGPRMRGKTINAIINSLYEQNEREEDHSYRVSAICKSMGEALGLTHEENEELKTVGLLHDIGKIGVDEAVINKVGLLTEEENDELKRHSEIGYRMLNTVNGMSDIANYVLHHHERWDGKGYPKGLKGEEIPFVSRIISISDAYDEMSYENSTPSPSQKVAIIEKLQKGAGVEFDPMLVTVFIEKVLDK